MNRVGVLDLGTNTFRLLIAGFSKDQTLERHRIVRRIVRIGEGFLGGGVISEVPLKRAGKALKEFSSLLRREGVDRVLGVATGVFREASNAGAVLEDLARACDFPIRTITGIEEGAYILRGVGAGRKLAGDSGFLIVDIGGGSTEFVMGDSGGETRINSIPVGVVYLKERFADSMASDPDTFLRMEKWTERVLEDAVPMSVRSGSVDSIGTGGTMATLSYMDLGLRHYEPSRIHGSVLTPDKIERILAAAREYPADRLRRRYHLEKGRADLVLFGAALVRGILKRLQDPVLSVSDYGLLEGVAAGMLEDSPSPEA